MGFEANFDSISDFLDHLPHSALDSAPSTHFPVQLPLTFPSSLHHINFLTVLHLVYSVLSSPSHSRYFSESSTDPHEVAIRGVMGMFLASDESWTSKNVLSGQSWKRGIVDEEKVSEFFGIEVMREKDHETLKGVKVGGRWTPGVNLAAEIVSLLKRLGAKIPGKCVGEAVVSALGNASAKIAGRKGPSVGSEYASQFCDEVLNFEKSLADQYPHPSGTVLHAVPLRLLQDLSVLLPKLSDVGQPIPKLSDISNISPLPLPISLILQFGLLSLPDPEKSSLPQTDVDSIRPVLSSINSSKIMTSIVSSKDVEEEQPYVEIIEVGKETMTCLETVSVEICREIWGCARFSQPDRSDERDKEWKQHMSMLDVNRVCWYLYEKLQERKLGVEIILAGD